MISKELVHVILDQYSLPWTGRHGLSHWSRVLENGRRFVELNNAKLEVVQLFAVFHDAKRVNERMDFDHGRRGADYASSLRGKLFDLSKEDFDLLYTACAYHTDGLTESDVTVMCCWDADRLDLGRIGIDAQPQYLCTDSAKNPDLMEWAGKRSHETFVPDLIRTEWGIDYEKGEYLPY